MRALPTIVALTLLACPACAAPQEHPHFDDGGTLTWFKTLDEAKAAAKQADRLIFVEYPPSAPADGTRASWGGCAHGAIG